MSSKARSQNLKDVAVKEKERTEKLPGKEQKWEKPVLEDVSGRVMAQPYIRFT